MTEKQEKRRKLLTYSYAQGFYDIPALCGILKISTISGRYNKICSSLEVSPEKEKIKFNSRVVEKVKAKAKELGL